MCNIVLFALHDGTYKQYVCANIYYFILKNNDVVKIQNSKVKNNSNLKSLFKY